jgi:hypothetical protein
MTDSMTDTYHPFASYNKPGCQPSSSKTFVGNWVEEQSLQATTGTSRYEVRQASLLLLPHWPPCMRMAATMARDLHVYCAAMGRWHRAHKWNCVPTTTRPSSTYADSTTRNGAHRAAGELASFPWEPSVQFMARQSISYGRELLHVSHQY